MFSYEDRIKAVKLLIKYNMSYSNVRRELGNPSKESLRKWPEKNGDLKSEYIRKDMYSEEEKLNAVNYLYLSIENWSTFQFKIGPVNG